MTYGYLFKEEAREVLAGRGNLELTLDQQAWRSYGAQTRFHTLR
jgi:hypothetical protein